MLPRIEKVSDFKSELLQNTRSLYVYLPPSYYSHSTQRYPVLYMQDGQHVFEEDAFGGSWEAHLTADRLIGKGWMREIIIVGVASLPAGRASEYFHGTPDVRMLYDAIPAGELYERFLVEEVKPFIDRRYRTWPDRDNTAILGSSAGGLVSYHIAFRRSDVFAYTGIMSPFFQYTRMRDGELIETPIYRKFTCRPQVKVWMDMGGSEGLFRLEHARRAADDLVESGFVPGENLMFLYEPDAEHNQRDWARRLQSPLLYFFGKIGRPVRMEMHSSRKVGIRGPVSRVYPNVEYDSGYRVSLLRARYRSSNPNIVAVESDGTLCPKLPGIAFIEAEFEGLTQQCKIEVVPELSPTVEVQISVRVPEDTKEDDPVHVGLNIPKAGRCHYAGTFRLPRDLTFALKISRGFGLNERRDELRRFTTSENLALHYEVEAWEQL